MLIPNSTSFVEVTMLKTNTERIPKVSSKITSSPQPASQLAFYENAEVWTLFVDPFFS